MNGQILELLSRLHGIRSTTLSSLKPDFLLPKAEELLARRSLTEEELLESILVHYSSFFRDPVVFSLIGAEILPDILAHSLQTGSGPRLWSAGCAQGEEAYSLAILLQEALAGNRLPTNPTIFATDLCTSNLDFAEEGIYPPERLEQVMWGHLNRYFSKIGKNYKVDPALREMIHFSRDDLLSEANFAPADSVFGDFDLILCRNVAIYYTQSAVRNLMNNLCSSLRPGGWLVLGDSEYLPPGIRLATVHSRYNIFRNLG